MKEEKTEIVPELSLEFHFDILLKIIKRTHSTYCYQLKELVKSNKNKENKTEIQTIYTEHKGNYDYRRATHELRNRAFIVNNEKMKVMCLIARIRRRHQYFSLK